MRETHRIARHRRPVILRRSVTKERAGSTTRACSERVLIVAVTNALINVNLLLEANHCQVWPCYTYSPITQQDVDDCLMRGEHGPHPTITSVGIALSHSGVIQSKVSVNMPASIMLEINGRSASVAWQYSSCILQKARNDMPSSSKLFSLASETSGQMLTTFPNG